MADVHISAGPFVFTARLAHAAAPRTCAKFATMLPYRQRLIYVRCRWVQFMGLTSKSVVDGSDPPNLS